MKSAAFNQMIADSLTTPLSAVTDYARRLKEAGLLSTGARGRHAPDMTPLDAARLVLAILTTSSPAQCVERVKRFGPLPYSPDFRLRYNWYETIQPEEYSRIFKADTLEGVLAEMFGLPLNVGIAEACTWYEANVFGLRVNDFNVLAELVAWDTQDNTIMRERVIPFKGKTMVKSPDGKFRHIEGFTPIPGGVRSERSMSPIGLSSIGIGLWADDAKPGLQQEQGA